MKLDEKQAISTPEGILVRLKNKICAVMGVDLYQLKCLIDQFINETEEGANGKSNMLRANTCSELNKPKMTFKVFFKFLRILRLKKITIKLVFVTETDQTLEVNEEITFMRKKKVG